VTNARVYNERMERNEYLDAKTSVRNIIRAADKHLSLLIQYTYVVEQLLRTR